MTDKYLEIALTDDVRAAQLAQYGRRIEPIVDAEETPLGAAERRFIAARDSFYLATVSATGWPYIQHRGGRPGFLCCLDERTLAFADRSGNRQLVSRGNLASNDRVSLFLIDYAARRRLKILGRAESRSADDAIRASLAAEASIDDIERILVIHVVAFDWNCPKHITPRHTAADIEALVGPLKRRIAELEARLEHAGGADGAGHRTP